MTDQQRLVNAGRLLAALVVIGLTIALISGKVDSDKLMAALAALAALAVLLALTPANVDSLAAGLKKVTVGPFEFEWVRDARAAADQSEAGETPVNADTLLDLRLALEAKLTWMAKHLGDKKRWPLGYLSIGSLEYDNYLTKEQARTATRILTASEETLKRWPASAHDEFLRDARILCSNVRASTFFELVRQTLEDARQEGGKWTVFDLGREAGRRPDLQAERGGTAVRIAAVFPYKRKGDEAIAAAQKRLQQSAGGLPGVVVIPRFIHQYPGHYDDDRAKPDATPPVVYLDDLTSAVAEIARGLPDSDPSGRGA